MKVFKKYMAEIEEIKDIICNKCQSSCKKEEDFEGLIEVEVRVGYGTSIFNDGDEYIFSLCEDCLNKLFSKFLIPPEHKKYY